MKKILLLAAGAAALTLGACNKKTCPAYSAAKPAARTSVPTTASATTAPVGQ